MNSVVPAVESIHGVNLYAIVLLAPGKLPRVKHNLNRGLLCVCVCCMVMSSSILLFLFLHSVHLELCMFTRPDRDSLMVHCIRSTCSCVPISECVCHVAHANCSALVFLVHRSVNNLPIPKQFPCTDYSHAHLSLLSVFPLPTHTQCTVSSSPLSLSLAMGVAAQMIGDLVTGRVTDTTDFSTATLEESTDSTGPGNGEYLSAFLRWRAQHQSDTLLFTLVDAKVRVTESHFR